LRTAGDAAEWLRSEAAELVIADWPLADDLLRTMRAEDLRAPVIVFARNVGVAERAASMSLGATDVVTEWGDLFREIDRVISTAV
jgi:DNA-binding response OmpR family regulator